MYNHTPENYNNPFLIIINGEGFENSLSNKEDVFYQDEYMTAFISPKQWPNNPGNALIIPNVVYENIYDIPDEILSKIHIFSKKLAIAMKEVYKCDGTSIRQHNESAGNQEVWHYHLHVFPRYKNDNLYKSHDQSFSSDPDNRIEFAEKLREYFSKNN